MSIGHLVNMAAAPRLTIRQRKFGVKIIWLPKTDTSPNYRMENSRGVTFSRLLTGDGFSDLRAVSVLNVSEIRSKVWRCVCLKLTRRRGQVAAAAAGVFISCLRVSSCVVRPFIRVHLQSHLLAQGARDEAFVHCVPRLKISPRSCPDARIR